MKILTLFFIAIAALAQPADPALELVTFPPLASAVTTAPCIMDASGERAGSVTFAAKTGSITHVIFSTTTVTVAETLRAGVYTVDSSGNPTTTDFGGSAYGTQASPAASTAYRVALSTPASVTKGDAIAPMVDFDSAIGNLRINYGAIFSTPGRTGISTPRGVCYTGSWASQIHPAVLYEYSDGTIYSGANQVNVNSSAATNSNFNSSTASTPHRGNRITMAYSMLATDICVVVGTWAASSSAIFRITDTNRNTLASTGIIPLGLATSTGGGCYPLTASLPLSKDASYYIFAIPQSTDNIQISDITRIPGWNSYAPISDSFVRIQGDQASGFTEAETNHYTMVVQGVRLPTAGGFTVTQ